MGVRGPIKNTAYPYEWESGRFTGRKTVPRLVAREDIKESFSWSESGVEKK